MQVSEDEKKETKTIVAAQLSSDRNDPFVYFANVIRGNIKMKEFDLSSPATNDVAVKIIHASKQSAKSGKTIIWSEFYKH